MTVRFGILGMGKWARTAHIPNILHLDGTEIAALWSRSAENREAAAALCPRRPALFGRWEDLVASDEVDAVLVCTPNRQHASQAIAALRAGKHVLCEKPVALVCDEARALKEAADESGSVFASGYELRSADVVVASVEAIRSSRIGEVLMVTGSFWRSWGAMRRGWRGDPAASGGLIHEIYSHTADLQAYLVGRKPESVCARAAAADGPPHWDRLVVESRYPGGAMSVGLLCTRAAGAAESCPFEVCGTDGRLVGDVVGGRLALHAQGRTTDLSPQRAESPAHGFPGSLELVREFTECVVGARPTVRAGIDDALATFHTCLAIERSIETGSVCSCE